MKRPLTTLIALATAFAAPTSPAGESPYNPNAQPAQRPTEFYYVCVAQSRDFVTHYVSSVGRMPADPSGRNDSGPVSLAWSEYLNQTVGRNRTMNAHCNGGGSEQQMQAYHASELDPKRSPKVQAIDWTYSAKTP